MMPRRRTLFVIVNGVSLSRLFLGAFFLYSYVDTSAFMHRISFAVIALAVVTDFVDGALARRFEVTTKFGYLIDGITDRAAYVAVVLGIAARNGFPLLLGYVIIVRDFLLYGGRAYFPRWIQCLPLQRVAAHFHAGALRGVFGVYLVADALASFGYRLPTPAAQLLHWMPHVTFLLACASYYSLWLVLREQARLHGYTPLDELED
jgi:phosphatidylglycerophosphate synthase